MRWARFRPRIPSQTFRPYSFSIQPFAPAPHPHDRARRVIRVGRSEDRTGRLRPLYVERPSSVVVPLLCLARAARAPPRLSTPSVYTAAKPDSVAIISVASTPRKRWWLLSTSKAAAREVAAALMADRPVAAGAAAGLRCEI